MDLVDVLGRIEQINRADVDAAEEFGRLELGPRGVVVTDLLCVDGVTTRPASSQVRQFYAYALWWRLCSVELEWCDPRAIAATMSEAPVRDVLDGDFGRGNLSVPGMSRSNSVLFALDNRASPFDRAYLVFDASPEPRVVYAGSEVSEFEDLHAYLLSWYRTLV